MLTNSIRTAHAAHITDKIPNIYERPLKLALYM